MLNLHKDHKNLVLIAFSVFVTLSICVAIIPAYQMEEYEPIPGEAYTLKADFDENYEAYSFLFKSTNYLVLY